MSCSERQKEIKRRRHRKKKMEILARKLKSGQKDEVVSKLRALTPGATQIMKNWDM